VKQKSFPYITQLLIMSTRHASPSKKSDKKNPTIDSDSPITENKKNQTNEQTNEQTSKQTSRNNQATNQSYQGNTKQKQQSKITSKETSKSIDRQIN
jgi:hypothetical protein